MYIIISYTISLLWRSSICLFSDFFFILPNEWFIINNNNNHLWTLTSDSFHLRKTWLNVWQLISIWKIFDFVSILSIFLSIRYIFYMLKAGRFINWQMWLLLYERMVLLRASYYVRFIEILSVCVALLT